MRYRRINVAEREKDRERETKRGMRNVGAEGKSKGERERRIENLRNV